MMAWLRGFFGRVFARPEPAIVEARTRDAAAFVPLHAASFNRGWSEEEFERLLMDRATTAHAARVGRRLAGFIVSRLVADEAEILSVAVSVRDQSRGIGKLLLTANMRRLAGRGARTIFLEVDANNTPALRLYRRAGFREVGQRAAYYRDPAGKTSAALVLRRDLA